MISQKITTRTIILSSIDLDNITIDRVDDSPTLGCCRVTIAGPLTLDFEGDEYKALGQWTDESMLKAVIAKLEAKAIE